MTLPHVDPTAPRGPLYRAFAALQRAPLMGRLARLISWKADPYLMRWTRGRVRTSLMLPTALLETRGARTGLPRRNAVIYFHDGEHVVIVASHMGAPRHPAWYHNVRAHPEVTLGGLPFHAAEVEDEADRERLWSLADRVFSTYAAYRADAARAGRVIPLLRLTPVRRG